MTVAQPPDPLPDCAPHDSWQSLAGGGTARDAAGDSRLVWYDEAYASGYIKLGVCLALEAQKRNFKTHASGYSDLQFAQE